MSFKILPVIMSGSSGTRLWPLSTTEAPKQFHALATSNTMIQETALRLTGENYLRPVVICGRGHLDLATRQLDMIGRAPQVVVLEPMARNTAAVAAAAALSGAAIDSDALVLLLPADHVITDPQAFQAAVARAAETAKTRIVTFGIHPSHPETGFGYIERGEALSDGVFGIRRFCEKPDLDTAQTYVASGLYDWNAGIFLFSPQVMLQELQRHAPEVLAHTRDAFDKARTLPDAKPRVILFDTLMGKGVPFLEQREKNHFIRVDPPEWQQALDILDQSQPYAQSEGTPA